MILMDDELALLRVACPTCSATYTPTQCGLDAYVRDWVMRDIQGAFTVKCIMCQTVFDGHLTTMMDIGTNTRTGMPCVKCGELRVQWEFIPCTTRLTCSTTARR